MRTGSIDPTLVMTTAMVCGLVDIEFCKLLLGLESVGLDKFLNSCINLAAGSEQFMVFAPGPPVKIRTGLEPPLPNYISFWDKIEIIAILT